MLISAPAHRLEDAAPVGDAAAFERLRRWGGSALVHDLVRLFRGLTPERLQAARAALATCDAAAAEAAAHTLGSSCGQLGAVRMQRLCLRMERLAGAGNLAPAAGVLGELEDEFRHYQQWLANDTTVMELAA